jgi:beta-lactamase class A
MLADEIEAIASAFSGTIGVWGRRLPDGETVAVRPDEPFETASAIKTLIMAAALRRVSEGRDALSAPLAFDESHYVLGSGILRELTPGLRLTLRDVLVLMIAVSDNIATNMLLDRVGGVDAVNAEAARLGMASTRLLARLDFESGANDEGFGRSTPQDMGRLYALLHAGRCVGEAEDGAMIDILLRQQVNTALTRDLPYALVAPPHVRGARPPLRIASKSGSWEGCRCDCGIFYGPRGDYILGVWSKGCKDLRFHVDNEALVLLPKISRLVWDRWGAAGE